MTRIIFIFLSLITLLHSSEYPKFFSALGTPLYKADEAFMQLSHLEGMEELVQDYHSRAQHLLSVAKNVESDPKTKKKERKEYVKRLRLLQKDQRKILLALNAVLLKSIDNDDYATFLLIMETDIEAILENNVIRKRVMAYYLENRTRKKVPTLDKVYASIDADPYLLEYVQGHLPKVQWIEDLYSIDGPTRKISTSSNDKYAYSASGEQCFKLLSIRNFSSASEVSSYAFPEQGCRLVNVEISHDYQHAYLSDLNNGFAIIDITNPQFLIMRGEYPRIKALYSVTSKDDKTAFVVHENRGLSILDISYKDEPRLLANYNHGLKASSLAFDESRSLLYVSHNKGLSVLDVSTLGNPREVFSYEVKNGSSDIKLSLKKKVAYLSSLDEGVHVLSISDNNITHISSYQTPKSAQRLELSKDENSLFISAMEDGVYHVDTSDLKDLRHKVTYRLKKQSSSQKPFRAFSTTLNPSQTHLYISYGNAGIAKVDLKQ